MIDLDNLTESQQKTADAFTDAMLAGKEVSYLDFPWSSQREFVEIAEALLDVWGVKNATPQGPIN